MENEESPQELAEKAKSNYLLGNFPAAVEAFTKAASAYALAGDTLMAAEMNNNQSVALLKDKRNLEALEASQGTEVIFAQAGDDRRRGMAIANQASALEALRRFDEAIRLYCLASEVLETAGEDELRFKVTQLLSALYFRRLKILDAIISLQAGLVTLKNPTSKQLFLKKLLFLKL